MSRNHERNRRNCADCGHSNIRTATHCAQCGTTMPWSLGGLAQHSYAVVSRAIVYLLIVPVLAYMVVDVSPWRLESVPPTVEAAGATCVMWRLADEPLLGITAACQPTALRQWPYMPWLDRTVIDATIEGTITQASPIVDFYAPAFALVDTSVDTAQRWLNQQIRIFIRRLPWYQPPEWPYPDAQAYTVIPVP